MARERQGLRLAGWRRPRRLFPSLLLAGALFNPVCLAQEDPPLELAVKAAFLEKFPLFITWPEDAFATPTSPFNICVIGGGAFGVLLDRAVEGQAALRHPMAVHQVPALNYTDHCQIAYFRPDAGSQAIARQLAEAAVQPILTVTDGASRIDARGIINFVIVDDRVRFAIKTSALSASRLVISSKLLSLAVSDNAAP
jgi:hypothetical protein